MKNFNIFALTLIVAFVTFSCSKDKDNDDLTTKNYLKIGTEAYNLKLGLLENYGTDDESDQDWRYSGYNIDLQLISDGLSISEDEEDFEGTGAAVYFEMFSSANNGLAPGDYNFDDESPFPEGTYDYGEAYQFTNSQYISTDIESGKVSVKKSGDSYEISIDCTNVNGVKITGFYKGTLTYIDYSSAEAGRIKPVNKLKK